MVEYSKENIRKVLEALKRKGVRSEEIADVLSPAKKIVPLSIIRERFKR